MRYLTNQQLYKEPVVRAFQKPSCGRRCLLIHSISKQYSILSLERDIKHYYFIIQGDDENMTKLIEDLINEYAEIARKEAIVEGKAQGIAEGRAEGMAAGKAEAMQEAKKNQIIAIRSLLKTTNSTPENLAAAFNIPIEEVNRIAREG